MEARKRLYALSDILAKLSPTARQFHQALCQGRGERDPGVGFCQSKRRVLWALCFTHLTGSGRMRGSPVPPNTLLMSRHRCACQWCVCCPYQTQSGLSLSRHLRPLAAHARGMCLIYSLYCAGGPCPTLARIPSPPICSS